MWYVRVWVGPQSCPLGAMIGRFGVTGFVSGGGTRSARMSTLGWGILLPGMVESPYADTADSTGRLSLRTEALVRLATIAQQGRYYSATYIYAKRLDEVR